MSLKDKFSAICCEHLEEPVDPITKEKTTELIYKKGARDMDRELDEMSVKENFETCDKDYVCQSIDPICGPCFEYTGSVSFHFSPNSYLFLCCLCELCGLYMTIQFVVQSCNNFSRG